jgi:hypothetical protein
MDGKFICRRCKMYGYTFDPSGHGWIVQTKSKQASCFCERGRVGAVPFEKAIYQREADVTILLFQAHKVSGFASGIIIKHVASASFRFSARAPECVCSHRA